MPRPRQKITEPCYEVYSACRDHLARLHAPCPDDLRRQTGLPIQDVIEHLRTLKHCRLIRVSKADGSTVVVSVDDKRTYHVDVLPSTGPMASAARFSHMALSPMSREGAA